MFVLNNNSNFNDVQYYKDEKLCKMQNKKNHGDTVTLFCKLEVQSPIKKNK